MPPPSEVKVKICGNTNLDDAMAAVQAGADAVGFVFYAKSPRAVDSKTATPRQWHFAGYEKSSAMVGNGKDR